MKEKWCRFVHGDREGFGTVDDAGVISVHEGEMFGANEATGATVALDAVSLLAPCQPTKIIGLWNNLRAAAAKFGWAIPGEPLYFFKPPSSVIATDEAVVVPRSYDGRVLYEGELGVVIGRRAVDVAEADVDDFIFGYTCVNDVTALETITADPSFAQWCRAKSFDSFAPLGPVVATDIDPDALQVQTLLNGRVRQDYPVADMIFSPRRLVSLLSRDMTLMPGDVIACGTSVGALPMKAGAVVEVSIEGIGVLRNRVGERES